MFYVFGPSAKHSLPLIVLGVLVYFFYIIPYVGTIRGMIFFLLASNFHVYIFLCCNVLLVIA